MAKTKEELEVDKKAAKAAKKPYTVGEVAGKVGDFFSEAFSGPTSNYIKRQERAKKEAGQDNTGRASATAAAVANTVGKGVSKVAGEIAEAAKGPVTPDNINTGSASSSAFGGVIPKTTSGNAAGETAEPEAETSFYEAPTNKELEFQLGMQSKENQAAINKPLSDEAQGVIDLLASRRLDADLQGKSTELAGGAPQKDFSFGGAVDDVMGAADKGKFNPNPLEGAAEFDKELGELSKPIGRAKEGETADQYEGRLKERNAEIAELQSQKPYDSVLAGTFKNEENRSDLPTIATQKAEPSPKSPASTQASASARATASSAPTVLTDPNQRLKGRQEFGSYLEKQLNRSGGSYTFNKGDQSRAKALGIGRKEMDNFMNKLGRRDDDNQFGARGGLRRRNT